MGFGIILTPAQPVSHIRADGSAWLFPDEANICQMWVDTIIFVRDQTLRDLPRRGMTKSNLTHRRARPTDGVAGSDAGRADEPHNHPSSQPMKVVIEASPSGVTKERSQLYQRPLQAKRTQTIAQTTAPTPKRPNRATSAPSTFPSMFPSPNQLRRPAGRLPQCGEVATGAPCD
jgi:hypothetical protein